ncbi:two-component system response regulator [Alteromonas halophila]|uniref:EAL domain-containing protein n=1 Tax=Alteromonas halophila TaxID=516698 RepID=A0A918MXK7_9ALTE|nr:EAL domain-containing protein [Alteromonas halophila]GGW84489.1 hypothetical protein GCM10007391_17780 [Alteromonas halophila]
MCQLEKSTQVVIFNDDSSSLSTFASALSATYTIMSPDNPENVLATCIELKPLVVILDIELSQENGLDAARLLKANPATSYISIIFTTSHYSSEIEGKALAAGASDILPKPLQTQTVALRISNQLKLIHQTSALEKVNRQLYSEKKHLHATLASIGDAVITTNQHMLVTFMNPAAERITGWKSNAAVGLAIDEVMDLRDVSSDKKAINPLYTALRENRAAGVMHSSKVVNKVSGEFRIKDSASPVVDQNGELIGGVIVFQDITEAIAMATKMSHLAHHDHLTGLPNRLLLNDRLAMLIKEASLNNNKLAFLLVDIDNFKLMNDTLGHNGGDAVIKYVAQKLEEVVPESVTISRVGGDEFVILLRDIQHLTHLNKIASHILSMAEEQVLINNQYVRISLSIGISLFPYDAKDADQLMRHADNAMYNVKGNGKNNYAYYSQDLTAQLTKRVSIERALHAALKEGRLQVYFQPQINMVTGKLTGAEALARLTGEDGRFIPPDEFIPIAEEIGLISSLGKLVLEKSCAQARQWLDQGTACKVAVNVAAQQFNDHRFSETVVATMKKYNLPSQYLELEITESALVEDFNSANLTLEALKRSGISVALDDFGTGYSSLSYLRSFKLDVIKIDKSFVKDVTCDPQAACIVKAIIGLAKSLNLHLVCEGVESCEHEALLIKLGCADAQGYLYSKPLPVDDFNDYLVRNSLNASDTVCSMTG